MEMDLEMNLETDLEIYDSYLETDLEVEWYVVVPSIDLHADLDLEVSARNC